MVDEVGDPEFLALRSTLVELRDTGEVTPKVQALERSDEEAMNRIVEASKLLPASWVRAGNRAGLVWVVDNKGKAGASGAYFPAAPKATVMIVGGRKVTKPEGQALLHVNDDPGTALHEYTHHLQAAMPELDGHFQALHRRRTEGEKRGYLPAYAHRDRNGAIAGGPKGRKDEYVDEYFGTEYPFMGANGPALEVMPRAIQTLFYPLKTSSGPKELLPDLLRKDPEMLDLTLGLLFGYDPP